MTTKPSNDGPSAVGLDEKFPTEDLHPVPTHHSRDEEKFVARDPFPPGYFDEDGERHYNVPAETANDLVTEVIHATDDPTLNPWTFRVWFLGKKLFVSSMLQRLTYTRTWLIHIWRHARHHLLL